MRFLEKNLLWFAGVLFLAVAGFIAYTAWTRRKRPATTTAPRTDPYASQPSIKPVNMEGRMGEKAALDAPAIPIRYKMDVQEPGIMFKDDPGETWYGSDENA